MFRLFNCCSFLIILLSIRVCIPQIVGYADDLGEPAFVPRVVNGWPAKLGDVPYQLAFKGIKSRFKNTYYTFCGGSIIGPDKVLSAAHCFDDKTSGCERCWGAGKVSKKRLEKSFAVAGNLQSIARYQSTDSLENGQWRELKSIYLAPRYRFPRNDIAVGFTKQPFTFNSNVASIPYAMHYRDYAGKCLASGYGRISTWSQISSEVLLLAHLELFSTSWCSRVHRRNMRKFICTSTRVSDVAKGDSGGPLVCRVTNGRESNKGVLVGVVSGSRRRVGSFFTRVSSFREFVEKGRSCVKRSNAIVVLMSLLYGILLFSFYFIFLFPHLINQNCEDYGKTVDRENSKQLVPS